MKLTAHDDVGAWSGRDLGSLEALGFEAQGRLEDGVNAIAVLTLAEPGTYACLYDGTPYVEFHTQLERGYWVVTTDTPSRVDEFGEHEGRREQPHRTTQHRFLEPDGLLQAHRQLVDEVATTRGAPRPALGLEGAQRMLLALHERRSWRDFWSIMKLILIFAASVALALGALTYFGE